MSIFVIIAILVVLIAIGGAAAYWWMNKSSSSEATTKTTSPTPSTSSSPSSSTPTTTSPPQPSSSSSSNPLDKFTLIENKDFAGNDITGMANVPLDVCANTCNSLPTCVGFVRNKESQACYFKNSMQTSQDEPKGDAYIKK